MQTKKGWNHQLMMSLFQKESPVGEAAAYDSGVTMNSSNACSMTGFSCETEWADAVVNDKDDVTGKEHGYDQEIVEQGATFAYKEARAKPNSVAGIAGLCMGGITSTQDGELTAYKHVITPVAVGTAIPSIQLEQKLGGIQYAYKGVKGNSFKIAGQEGGVVSLEAALVGSGTRATSSTAFAAAITESWLKLNKCSVWMESGDNISIAAGAALVQGAENISSDTPDAIKARLKSMEFGWNNNGAGQPGFGGGGVFQDYDYGRRAAELKFSLLFYSSTELDYFINQNPLAIEFNLKGSLIAAGGAMYYGVTLIVPRFKIVKAPLPKGGVGDTLTQEFECNVLDDGTNSAAMIAVYNAQAAYLAAAA